MMRRGVASDTAGKVPVDAPPRSGARNSFRVALLAVVALLTVLLFLERARDEGCGTTGPWLARERLPFEFESRQSPCALRSGDDYESRLPRRARRPRRREADSGDGDARFARLQDSGHMLAVFRRELPAWTDTSLRVTGCVVERAEAVRSRRGVGGRDTLAVLYRLVVEIGGTEEREISLLALATAGSAPARVRRCAGLLEHASVAPFTRVGAYLSDLRAALMFPLLDPRLPALAEIAGARGHTLLASYLPECRRGARIERIRSDLRHYKPLRRAVLHVTASFGGTVPVAPPRSFYVKFFRDERGAASHRALEGLWSLARRSSHLRVPEPLGYDPRRRMLVMAEASGEHVLDAWIARLERGETLPSAEALRLRRCMAATVSALRDLQRSRLRPAERRSFRTDLERLASDRELLPAEVDAALASTIDRLLARLTVLAPEAERVVVAHGGFRHKQLLGDDQTLTIIDWDGICLASPALDPATFLVRLHHDAAGTPGAAPELVRLAALFRDQLRAELPAACPHLALYEGLLLTEQVLRSSRRAGQDAGAIQVAHNLAATAERMLERAVAAG